jgi:hypothetical protein
MQPCQSIINSNQSELMLEKVLLKFQEKLIEFKTQLLGNNNHNLHKEDQEARWG